MSTAPAPAVVVSEIEMTGSWVGGEREQEPRTHHEHSQQMETTNTYLKSSRTCDWCNNDLEMVGGGGGGGGGAPNGLNIPPKRAALAASACCNWSASMMIGNSKIIFETV